MASRRTRATRARRRQREYVSKRERENELRAAFKRGTKRGYSEAEYARTERLGCPKDGRIYLTPTPERDVIEVDPSLPPDFTKPPDADAEVVNFTRTMIRFRAVRQCMKHGAVTINWYAWEMM